MMNRGKAINRRRRIMRRPVHWCVTAGVAAALWTAPAAAQDEMSFGTEEVESVGEVSPVAQFLDEGKKYYDKKDYYQASLLFHKVFAEPDASADRFRPKAKYELAKSLYRLEFYQGALNLFAQIAEEGVEHPYYEATLSWLILLSRKLPGEPGKLERLGKYEQFFPNKVPEKFRDEFAFLLGKYFYQQADLDRTIKFLDYVSPRSDFYAEAKYHQGITYVRKYEAKPAVNSFKSILSWLSERDVEGDPKLKRLQQLTLLGMARAFYSVGQYDKSVKYYSFIGQSSEYWLDSLFEESWAYFQIDRFNKSLGNLHTLNSPFFDDEYFPESIILQAVAFFTNCRYDRVRLSIEEFDEVYPDLKKELQAYLDQYQDPAELYDFLVKINAGEGSYDPRLNQILNAALTDKALKRTIEYVDDLEAEIVKLDRTEPSWRDSGLGQTLQQDLDLSKSFALGDAGTLAQERLVRVKTELNDLIKQSKKILIETAKAETDQLDAKIRDQQFNESGPNQVKNEIKVDDEHIFWTFRGEYWRDELGFYLYNITSQCGR